jgi:Protein of unknown function (DUF3237)
VTETTTIPVEFLFRLEGDLSGTPAFVVHRGPRGTRIVATASSGTFAGPRLRGTLGPEASADWVTIRRDGSWELDVRVALHTDDGASILFSYTGFGTNTNGLVSLRGAPRFEVGDDRYSWLNDIQGVLIGEADPGRQIASYDVYALL